MRFSTILTSIRESLSTRQYSGKVDYRINTTSAAVVEVFIDGQVARRLTPALDSTTLLNCYGVIHTAAGSTFTNRRALVRCTVAGVLSLVDLDATSANNDVELASAINGPSGAVTGTAPVIPSSGVGSIAFNVVQPVGTVPGYISVTYTPVSAAPTFVELRADFIEAGSRG